MLPWNMPPKENSGIDILGIQPIAKAIEQTSEAVLRGAGAFLARICLPAAEEYGLLLKERVSCWRAINAAKIAAKAEALTAGVASGQKAHPRLVWQIIEKGSWADDDEVQKMWAGLLASSCSSSPDDSNLLFVSILDQLTSVEVRILKTACEGSPKYVSDGGLPFATHMRTTVEALMELSGVHDIHRLDRELDHIRGLGLIEGGLDSRYLQPRITVTPLALHLYVRAQGSAESPVGFWGLKPDPHRDKRGTLEELNGLLE